MTRKLISTKRIGKYVVRAYFTEMPLDLTFEWDPLPRRLTESQMAIYRRWRDEHVIPAIEEMTGLRMMMMVEI